MGAGLRTALRRITGKEGLIEGTVVKPLGGEEIHLRDLLNQMPSAV